MYCSVRITVLYEAVALSVLECSDHCPVRGGGLQCTGVFGSLSCMRRWPSVYWSVWIIVLYEAVAFSVLECPDHCPV